MEVNFTKSGTTLAELERIHRETLVGHLGIQITAIGPQFVYGEMPVDTRTVQPFGILHGGASIVLAESLGSVASSLLVMPAGGRAVGIEVNGSHMRAAVKGRVTGCCRPLKIGRGLHFWHIELRNELGELTCDARLTIKILWPRDAASD